MKKKILGLTLIAISAVSFSSMAQQPTATDNCTQKKECIKNGKQCRANKPNPFEGMNLTDTQKSQLKQLDENNKAARKQMKEAKKQERQKMNQQNRQARMEAKKKYLNDVKNIVGEDNYVIYLENIVLTQPGQKGGKMMKPGKGPKDHKGDRKGARPDGQPKAPRA
ncbi:MAG: hypothetical protein NC338_03185 [Firmicutes bacterium]|nr:hypothetical protein [Bacillota bacterium]MCM1400856.1 hypothetical protein [Bacteroides sp.]MCM1476642.1 hypothetical protein [Bacteroides sp.]